MRNVSELRVTLIRLYPVDRIPFQSLFIARHLTELQGQFHFKSVGPVEEAGRPGIIFEVGDFNHDGKDYVVERLVIHPQKILLAALAPSAVCYAAHRTVEAFLTKIDPYDRFADTTPMLATEETNCAADLDLDLASLLSKPFLEFMSRELEPAVSHPLATAMASPSRIAVKVNYTVNDPAITAAGLRFADKILLIEPRAHTSHGERRFFTQSPTDSETHLRLLQLLEQAFK